MSEIKQIKQLNSVLNVRKITQQSLKPIIEEIENKMSKLQAQTDEFRNQASSIQQLSTRLSTNQKTIELQNTLIRQNKQSLHSLLNENQLLKNQIETNKKWMKQQIMALTQNKLSQNTIIDKIKDKNQQTLQEIIKAQRQNKQKQLQLEQKLQIFKKQIQSTQKKTTQENQQFKKQFTQLKVKLAKEFASNEQNLNIMSLYCSERDSNAVRMQNLEKYVQGSLRMTDFEMYKHCLERQISAVVDQVSKLIDQNLSEKTRKLLVRLPQMDVQVRHVLQFQQRIDDLMSKLEEFHFEYSQFQQQQIEKQKQIKSEMERQFSKVEGKSKQANKKITYLMALQNTLLRKLSDYGITLKCQMQKQNEQKSKKFYQKIKIDFADTKQKSRIEELNRIRAEREKLQSKTAQIEDLGNRIGLILQNYATKFTVMKSDSEIFMENMRREVTTMRDIKKQMMLHEMEIGRLLSYITEIIMLNQSIGLDAVAKEDQLYAFATQFDGVVYQRYSKERQPKEDNRLLKDNKIIYRRKAVNISLLKNSLMIALMNLNDEVLGNPKSQFLGWQKNKPSNFFLSYVYPNYKIQQQKQQNETTMDPITTILLDEWKQKESQIEGIVQGFQQSSTLKAKANKVDKSFSGKNINFLTIGSLGDQNDKNKKYNIRSRQDRKRYNESIEIFAPRSARRGRSSVNNI